MCLLNMFCSNTPLLTSNDCKWSIWRYVNMMFAAITTHQIVVQVVMNPSEAFVAVT